MDCQVARLVLNFDKESVDKTVLVQGGRRWKRLSAGEMGEVTNEEGSGLGVS